MSMSVSSAAYVGSLWYVELLYKSTYVRTVCIVLIRAVCKKSDAHGSVSVLCANVEVRHRIICCMSKNKCKIIFQNFNVNKCNNVIFNHIAFLHTLRGDQTCLFTMTTLMSDNIFTTRMVASCCFLHLSCVITYS